MLSVKLKKALTLHENYAVTIIIYLAIIICLWFCKYRGAIIELIFICIALCQQNDRFPIGRDPFMDNQQKSYWN